jgi:hypothetical protein
VQIVVTLGLLVNERLIRGVRNLGLFAGCIMRKVISVALTARRSFPIQPDGQTISEQAATSHSSQTRTSPAFDTPSGVFPLRTILKRQSALLLIGD